MAGSTPPGAVATRRMGGDASIPTRPHEADGEDKIRGNRRVETTKNQTASPCRFWPLEWSHQPTKVGDGVRKALVERHAGLPVEQTLGQADIRLAPERIVLRQRVVLDPG